jgi:hypothetical protein
MSNNRQQSIYFMDFKSVQSETIEAYIDDETNGKGRRYRNRFRNKCKGVIYTNPLHQRQIPNLSPGNSMRHGTITENGTTSPRLHIVLITGLDNKGNPIVTHVTTKAKWKPSNGTVEILSFAGDRKKIMEASKIPTVEKLPVWCGASRDPGGDDWPHHVIFMLTDHVLRNNRDLIANLPLMYGDDREAWFFRVEITRGSSVCISPSIMRVLTGGATTQTTYLGNTAFRNAIRGVLPRNQPGSSRPPENQGPRKRPKLPSSIARHLYRATLTYNNTKFRYLFYPRGIKDVNHQKRVVDIAKTYGLEPIMYDLDRTGGYMVARHENENKIKKSTMVLLPRRTNTNNIRPFPPNTVPLFVEPLV